MALFTKENDVTTLTAHEQSEIDRANELGLPPVVFVHGLWLLSSSWDRWRTLFEENGYAGGAPGWPGDPDSVEEARKDPQVFARKMVKQVTDHYLEAIAALERKPAVVGHSFGGLIAQRLAGVGAARGHRRVRPRPVPRAAAVADLVAEVGGARAEQPGKPRTGRVADLRA